jgi:hypothetical protein
MIAMADAIELSTIGTMPKDVAPMNPNIHPQINPVGPKFG